MKIIDTRGKKCPVPIIEAKKALKEASEGEVFIILTDNRTSFDNLCRFLKDNKATFSVEEEKDIWRLTVTKGAIPVQEKVDELYCDTKIPHLSKGNFIIVFSSERMGEGDDDLGNLLMMNFIKAIKDLEILPRQMLFYNSGVKLGAADSPASAHLKDIESMGVELFFCATCSDHYSLRDKISLGSMSNMFAIAQMMASAGSVIKP
ncbi:MAG TPA: sulfurtransferase-like selenium metabolism protein YedF [Bacteroidales bacterium]|jgi:selenium metabolism protein YedF|nr:sulfurtransferase-like selenium metabolism protein YedF [Bacteroidales bacterium]OQB60267.1 MAG: SirA-like protein [Bacteroidetes bacterium ADurb.Bin145]NMD02307.1 sulfurtransferase-like selenium metabolism protein YedF [Bacteroidales bacterium]HOU03170.1 sulfurtransferase-like selenium metabolism protein YedF [Bacteroidales bacterium]HQG64027.1 sulfurtransferase-like selenium metabolism protein YedF [Bacteroidales bacterium]